MAALAVYVVGDHSVGNKYFSSLLFDSAVPYEKTYLAFERTCAIQTDIEKFLCIAIIDSPFRTKVSYANMRCCIVHCSIVTETVVRLDYH